MPPLVGVAVKFTVVPAQIGLAGLAVTVTEGTTVGVMATTIVLEVSVVGEAQGSFDVRITLMVSLLLKVEELKLGELLPAFTPFTCHWYAGVVPPLVGVAVKLMAVPAQAVVALATTVTEGATAAVIAIVIVLEVAVAGEAHASLEVKITCTVSPLLNELEL